MNLKQRTNDTASSIEETMYIDIE